MTLVFPAVKQDCPILDNLYYREPHRVTQDVLDLSIQNNRAVTLKWINDTLSRFQYHNHKHSLPKDLLIEKCRANYNTLCAMKT